MKKFGLLSLGLLSVAAFAACSPDEEQFFQKYGLHTCDAYVHFVECCSEFSLSRVDQQRVASTLEQIKQERSTLPEDSLEQRCNVAWDIIVSTPEFSEHPQCGIQR